MVSVGLENRQWDPGNFHQQIHTQSHTPFGHFWSIWHQDPLGPISRRRNRLEEVKHSSLMEIMLSHTPARLSTSPGFKKTLKPYGDLIKAIPFDIRATSRSCYFSEPAIYIYDCTAVSLSICVSLALSSRFRNRYISDF